MNVCLYVYGMYVCACACISIYVCVQVCVYVFTCRWIYGVVEGQHKTSYLTCRNTKMRFDICFGGMNYGYV